MMKNILGVVGFIALSLTANASTQKQSFKEQKTIKIAEAVLSGLDPVVGKEECLLYIHTAAEAAYPEFHFAADYSGPGISNPSTFGADANTHWTLQKVRGYGEMCKNLIQMMSNNRDAETTFYTVKSENGEAVLVGYVDRAKDLILLRQI